MKLEILEIYYPVSSDLNDLIISISKQNNVINVSHFMRWSLGSSFAKH